MFSFLSSKLSLDLITNKYVISGFLVLFFYVYYTYTNVVIFNLKESNANLLVVVEKQREQLKQLHTQYEKISESRQKIYDERDKLSKERDDLKEKLFRENNKNKSLEKLAIGRSSLVENLINKSTSEVLSCFDLISRGKEC